ncbi:hypothetical protein ACCS78_37045, partial [Rhizobium johnstonii]
LRVDRGRSGTGPGRHRLKSGIGSLRRLDCPQSHRGTAVIEAAVVQLLGVESICFRRDAISDMNLPRIFISLMPAYQRRSENRFEIMQLLGDTP